MPGMTEKEKCFDDAWKKYKDASGDKMDIESQRTWYRNSETGQWNNDRSWSHVFNSFMKFLRTGSSSTDQMRFPDLTITNGESKSVVDLKFTRADGTADDWRPGVGAGSNQSQKKDYNDINKQMNNGKDPYNNDPSLSAKSCKCDEPDGTAVEPITVMKPAESMDGKFFVLPAPGLNGYPGAVPAPGAAPELPGLGGFPGFEPVFP
jgi:hypothetical protein